MDSSPAVDQNGNIYATVCGNDNFADVSGGKLVSVTTNGVKRWMFKVPTDTVSSPAIADDGTVYFGARDRKLYAITPEGKLRWSFTTGAWVDASPAIGTNGVVYFGSWDQKFYALNPDGTRRWEYATEGPIDSSAAIADDGTIYFGSHDKKFYALNPDGSLKWSFPTQGAIISSPALDCNGTIYFTSADGKFYQLNPDGTRKREFWTGGVLSSSPVLDAEGNIYLGISNTFRALTPDGKDRWWFGYPSVPGSAAIAADGIIYFGSLNASVGVLFGFNHEGREVSYTIANGTITGSPAIDGEGRIYVGGNHLEAFKGTASLAKSCWSKARGGLRQTGRLEH